METLGTFDQMFYKADQYQVAHMIMSGVSILEPVDPGDPLDARTIADHIAARLQHIPLMRTKLVQDPLRLGSVRKVQDPVFDVRSHVAVESLAAPGGYKQLASFVSEYSARPMDLEHLWHWTVVDGLRGGKLAIIARLHHALADGIGAVQALSSMYDLEPVAAEQPEAERHSSATVPGATALLYKALGETAGRLFIKTPRAVVRNTGPLLSALGKGARELIAEPGRLQELLDMPEVQKTSLNITGYSGRRSVSWKTLALPEVKVLSRHFGCTVNDIGLLLYSCAMEHYFAARKEPVDFDLWCVMPISTRAGDSTDGGNALTMARINLHNTIKDLGERLRAIHQDTQSSKHSARPKQTGVNTEELSELMFPPVIDAMLYLTHKFDLMGRSSDRFLFSNAILSNVPGPREPVYIANGVIVESIPLIPTIDIFAVSGGFTSVDEAITLGFHCDGEAVEEPQVFVKGVELGLQRLRRAAGLANSRGSRSRARPGQRAGARKTTSRRKAASAGNSDQRV